MTDELVAFLRARLDEDEATAKGPIMAARFIDKEPDFYGAGGLAALAYWQKFDPIWMLGDIDGKRSLVAEHEPYSGYCRICTDPGTGRTAQAAPCLTLRLLGQPYRRHPDYRSEWAPGT